MPVAEVKAFSASPVGLSQPTPLIERTVSRSKQVDYVRPVPLGRRTRGVGCVRLAVKSRPSVGLTEWAPDPAKGTTRRIKVGVGPVYRRPTPARWKDEQVILGTGKSTWMK
jgi:hypothetical protein